MQATNRHLEEPADRIQAVSENSVKVETERAIIALQYVNKAITRLCNIKRKYGFDLEEVIIFAACGLINLTGAKQGLPFAQPANISSVAEYVRAPRETVRRKLQNIESKGLISRRSGGYLITSTSEWLAIVNFLASPRQF